MPVAAATAANPPARMISLRSHSMPAVCDLQTRESSVFGPGRIHATILAIAGHAQAMKMPPEQMMEIGKRVVAAREALGLTPKQLADAAAAR